MEEFNNLEILHTRIPESNSSSHRGTAGSRQQAKFNIRLSENLASIHSQHGTWSFEIPPWELRGTNFLSYWKRIHTFEGIAAFILRQEEPFPVTL